MSKSKLASSFRTLSFGWIAGCLAIAHARAQTVERLTLTATGAQSDGNMNYTSAVSLSPSGRWLCFSSGASNLVPDDTNGANDTFLLDRATGQFECQSMGAGPGMVGGDPVPVGGSGGVVSPDGSKVVFATQRRLVPSDTGNTIDVYLRYRSTGAYERISVGHQGQQLNAACDSWDISRDLRWFYFLTHATNVMPGDTSPGYDVFLRDLATGAMTWVTRMNTGPYLQFDASKLAATPSGEHVAFTSISNSLVPGDTNLVHDTFVWTRSTGVVERVSISTSGAQNDAYSEMPTISDDGRFVAFATHGSTLDPADFNFVSDVYVRDRLLGTTTRASVDAFGVEVGAVSSSPLLSPDGRWVAFDTYGSLLPQDLGGTDIYLRDLTNGALQRVTSSVTSTTLDSWSVAMSASHDGRQLLFASPASGHVPGDTNGVVDLFLVDVGPATIRPFCSGDGSATACPCGNAGALGRGCASSTSSLGGRLVAFGTAQVSADSLTLAAHGLPAGAPTFFFEGFAQQGGGTGVVFGDGLLCVGGGLVRLAALPASGGSAMFGAESGAPPLSILGAIGPAGGTVYYQALYRNAASFCTPATMNGTNGVEVAWVP